MTPDRAPTWVEHPDLVEYYSTARSTPEDLYASERRFLPWLAGEADSVLDVGCGAGGFAAIWDHFHPGIAYTGVDASASLIEAARRLHPAATFVQADGAGRLPFDDASFDVVAGLGWLHLEPLYPRALQELWRVTGRRLFFDVRLHEATEDLPVEQRLALAGDWDGRTTIPYIVASWPQLAAMLVALGPHRILAHGYEGRPADTVRGVDERITFATFVLERGVGGTAPNVALDLPLAWPAELPAEVTNLTDKDAAP